MTARPRPIETAPENEYVIGYHSEWPSPLVVLRQGERWLLCSGDGDRTIGGIHTPIRSAPLHWAPIPKFK